MPVLREAATANKSSTTSVLRGTTLLSATMDRVLPLIIPPMVHHYVFTVYALDKELKLPASANSPPTAAALFRALVKAGERGHILASASITGLYSTTPE